MLDLTADFARFRAGNPRRINLAAHSHHDWPDVTFDAQMRCWEDAARHAGDKWGVIFSEVMPAVQAGIANVLSLPDPESITFAPNTHDFLRRILSTFPAGRRVSVLATDAEFHTFRRQMARLEEDGFASVERVAVEPFASFADRFREAAQKGGHDLVFLSQIFFTSGATCGDLDAIVAAVPDDRTAIVIDGYHGFMARPTDLSRIAHRAFYMSGGYKYAMAGEGVCFMHVPPSAASRPRDTGWYADFGALAAPPGKSVGYPASGARFLGATFDPVGLYRQRAVFEWMEKRNLTVPRIHTHATALAKRFLDLVLPKGIAGLSADTLITPFGSGAAHGNFLTFRTERAGAIEMSFAKVGLYTDHRADRMRFGFGVCTRLDEIDEAAARIARALA
jgi:selenocysteine lyase/cysteine desulfurase